MDGWHIIYCKTILLTINAKDRVKKRQSDVACQAGRLYAKLKATVLRFNRQILKFEKDSDASLNAIKIQQKFVLYRVSGSDELESFQLTFNTLAPS